MPVTANRVLQALPHQCHFTCSIARIRVVEAEDIDIRSILPRRKVTTHSRINAVQPEILAGSHSDLKRCRDQEVIGSFFKAIIPLATQSASSIMYF
jgi:hypothetical protein